MTAGIQLPPPHIQLLTYQNRFSSKLRKRKIQTLQTIQSQLMSTTAYG